MGKGSRSRGQHMATKPTCSRSYLHLHPQIPSPAPFPPTPRRERERERERERFGMASSSSDTHLHDLPDVILSNVFALVTSTRSRNAMSLVCTKWLALERATRTSLSLRGNVRDLFLIPTSFSQVTNLDLSLLSPWGQSFLDSSSDPGLLAHRLAQAFPSLTSLTVYARTPSTLNFIAPHFPSLRHAKLVRWHQRSAAPLGSDFHPLFAFCPSISTLDLSHFYCWTEDLPPALEAHPSAAASLTRLDLLTLSSPDGFKSHELLAISASCPNLRHLLATCMFDPRYVDFVGDDALLAIAAKCPLLSLLHLADKSALSGARADPEDDGFTPEDARISRTTLEEVFAGLPLLEELTLDVCQNVRDAGPALETLDSKCPQLKSLALGQFHGICRAEEWQLDGVALCKNLEFLSIKNSADLTDSSLLAISRGCLKLAKFAIHGCKNITEIGMKRFAGMLRRTLVDVSISCCKHLDANSSLRALEPIRDRIQHLHIDCIWDGSQGSDGLRKAIHGFNLIESGPSRQPAGFFDFMDTRESTSGCCEDTKQKKSRYSPVADCSNESWSNGSEFWCKTWKRLRDLSLWIPVGELLTPLPLAGLESCPELEEIRIKVEGDCRSRPKPTEQAFGLSALDHYRYPRLFKMQLDCGDAIGYALTAPSGHMDLSLWERFYLRGIEMLNLSELDYWPPQDREVNQRSLSLPAAGLLAECATLRKLFIHGTAHEHFIKFLLRIPNLRDVQLREDYYPAPDNDTSTEMRVDSCSRFEDDLNRRQIPD
ncbi:F-box/LRR-repeat MAX2 homolog A [Magnolia sinica]|uniref:F-box/LRR-repeat MAX2 homolog A n=1 Tax=Magnolia sinica TaxID=86752 RepID=UPI00265B4EF0|nr:F-box/LRR-repeat MAX2 homolog A [Magnolia sinica]